MCVYLHRDETEKKGQIAHLNRDPGDPRFDNLIYLCLEHHDEYDRTTSQSKGYTAGELRAYRDKLYTQIDPHGRWRAQSEARLDEPPMASSPDSPSDYELVRRQPSGQLKFTTAPWRFPLWLVPDEPELFAYKAGNRADGVCLIERINLPDGRVVIACIQPAGNPGQSITNAVEEICFQVCERFRVPADRLVWLEHYDHIQKDWNRVTFGQVPPRGPFADPKWTKMTPQLWRKLRLRPRRKLKREFGHLHSNLTKLFPWPTDDLL